MASIVFYCTYKCFDQYILTLSPNQFQITIDVTNFDSKDLSVKVVEDNELVIEGQFNKVINGTLSKQSFKRSFCFPGINENSKISSKLSSNNQLTITIEKQVCIV